MIRRSRNRTNKLTSNTRGFSLLEAIIIVMIFAAVGIIGVLVVMRIQNSDKTTPSQDSNNTSQQPQAKEPTLDPEVYASYHSTLGGFTMNYPKSWIVEGIKGGTTTTVLDGTEEQLHFQVAPNSSKINNYGGNLRITTDPPGDEAWPIYPSGTLSDAYRNGMSLWRDNQSQVLKDGRKANTCPSLRIASKADSAFGYKLKNGKYISFIGSFCWTPGLSTTYSYGQQTESDEFSKTADMIRSIKQD
jgi:cytoskeletal protein RodZ